MIGIVLNVACNVDDIRVTHYMLDQKVLPVLCEILMDPRQDWPTNGASLAILHYSQLAFFNVEIFAALDENQTYEKICRFVNVCQSKVTKNQLYEAIALLQVCEQKSRGILFILRKQFFASSA